MCNPPKTSWHPALEKLLIKPLTEHADLAHIPLKDMESFVSRSVAIRHTEAGLSNLKSKRPSNIYLLYQIACRERAYAWKRAHLNELPSGYDSRWSTIISRSWALESSSVKAKYQALAETDRENHDKAFPGWKFVRKTRRNTLNKKNKPQTPAIAKLADAKLTDTKQTGAKASGAPQPLPSCIIEDVKFYPSPSTQNLPATGLSQPKGPSPHILQRLATLSGCCRELEALLKSCQTSEVMRKGLWPSDKGLDYQMAVLQYNDFVASVYDKLEQHVRDKKVLEPYVPKVYDLQFTFDEASGMYKCSPCTWPSLDLVSAPAPMAVTDQQLLLVGVENRVSTDINLASFMDIDPQLDDMFKDIDAVLDMSDEDIEKAFQEACANDASTVETGLVVDAAEITEPPQEEQALPPDFTSTEDLSEIDLRLDQALSELISQDVDMIDMIDLDMIMDESEVAL